MNHSFSYQLSWVLLFCLCGVVFPQSICTSEFIDLPSSIIQASRNVFSTHDGSYLAELSSSMQLTLTLQMLKVCGLPPESEFNITLIRQLPALKLVELLLLASIGNFTTSKSPSWQQPCRVVMNSFNGELSVEDSRSTTDMILSVLVIILCIVQLKQIMETL